MRLLTWPVEPARALARALAGPVSEVVEGEPWEAAAALAEGRCDLALVPTIEVLRDPASFELAPGVALAGETSPLVVLVVAGGLDRVRTLDFDPRYGQEALLAAVLLREHYAAEPAFAAANPSSSIADRLARHDAALVVRPISEALPDGAVVLDLGAEWVELTTRPFVWGLLAARPGGLTGVAARALADAARASAPGTAPGFQFTLDGYAHDGLTEFARHLFYHGALADLPTVSFVAATVAEGDGAAA